MKTLPRLLALLLLVPVGVQAQPVAGEAEKLLGSGPMVSYVEMTETAIWLQTTRPAEAQLRYWKGDAPGSAWLTPVIATSREGDLIATFVLERLSFGSDYEYEVYLEGEKVMIPHPTRFTTQRMWPWGTKPPELRGFL
jgi:alkaline phosphatase D